MTPSKVNASFPTSVGLDCNSALVSCEWLQKNLYRPHQAILDATFFLPRQQRNAREEFEYQHVLSAQFFDIDDIADLSSPLPHTLPGTDQFARQVGQLGIDNDTWVFVYDNNHFFAPLESGGCFAYSGMTKSKSSTVD